MPAVAQKIFVKRMPEVLEIMDAKQLTGVLVPRITGGNKPTGLSLKVSGDCARALRLLPRACGFVAGGVEPDFKRLRIPDDHG